MNVFGLGRSMLGMAYVLQLTGGAPGWKAMSMLNHTLALYVPLVYWIGASGFSVWIRNSGSSWGGAGFGVHPGTVLAPLLIWLVLRFLTDELRATAAHDPLTQLLNRRGLLAGLERAGSAGPMRLLMLDTDCFKQINDRYGHLVGDRVFVRAAKVLKYQLWRGSLASRTGGEEFFVACAVPSP
jgi:hypothetical protein